MNTKMILEVAGAKPLATRANTAGNGGKASEAKGLVAGKRPVAVPKNLGISHPPKTCNKASGGMTGPEVGLGEGMWRGVFGITPI